MNDVKVKLDVEVEISYHGAKDGEAVEKLLTHYFDRDGRWSPYRVIVRCPYAAWFEFGTAPSKKGPSKEFIKSMTKWVESKPDIMQNSSNKGKTAEQVAKGIAFAITKKGMPPHPFYRYAIYTALNDGKSKLPYALSKRVADIMKNVLMEEGSIFTQDLYNSISVERLTDGQIAEASLGAVDDVRMYSRTSPGGLPPSNKWGKYMPPDLRRM